jgi:hypothetical protein
LPVTTFAANAGNILQHAPLCEVVKNLVDHPFVDALLLVDAHAMAPLARARQTPRPEFASFWSGLRSSRSAYATAWAALTKEAEVYPSTANFIDRLWPGDLAMVLCENDPSTADAIAAWREALPDPRRERVEVCRGDWRARFSVGFTHVLPANDLAIASFDPYLFHLAGRTKDAGKMWPEDIDLIGGTFGPLDSVLVQISTYSTNGGNRLHDVRRCWNTGFQRYGLRPVGSLATQRHGMMTAFFAKGSWPVSRVSAAIRTIRPEIDTSLGDQVGCADLVQ